MALPPLTSFSESALRTLALMIRDYRRVHQGSPEGDRSVSDGLNWQIIVAVSATTAKVSLRNGYSSTWLDSEEIVQCPTSIGGGTMVAGERYVAVQTGHDASGRRQFVPLVPESAGGGFSDSAYKLADNSIYHMLVQSGLQLINTEFITPAGQLIATPFVAAPGTINRIGAYGYVGSSTLSARVGIYTTALSRTEIFPTDLVADGQITMTTDPNEFHNEVDIEAELEQDRLYYAAILLDNQPAISLVYYYCQGPSVPVNATPTPWPLGFRFDDVAHQTYANLGYFKSGVTFGSLPSTFPADAVYLASDTGIGISGPPVIYGRYA